MTLFVALTDRFFRLCLAACLVCGGPCASAQPNTAAISSISMDERGVRALVEGESLLVRAPVRNRARQPVPARFRAEILDPADRVAAASTVEATLQPGDNQLTVIFSNLVSQMLPHEREKLLWYRLRYEFTTDSQTQKGIVSLGSVTAEFFDIRVAWSRFLFPGDQRRLSVLALNPVTRAPVRGVEVEAIEDSDSASA
ncbi:MAG: hypothetical protein ACRD2Q_10155, partial [Terriglobales bacterium]